MTFESTHKLVEQNKVRINLTANERERLKECENALEIALRAKFGNRLNEIMVRDIVNSISRDPEIFHFVVTGETTEVDPSNRASFLPFAEAKVQANSLARRNIAFSDEALRTKLADDFMQSLKPDAKIKFDRDGTLTKRIADYVENQLDQQTA